METLRDSISGDLSITDDTVLLGIISGNVTVCTGFTFILNGIVSGSVYVEKNGILKVHGIVDRDIYNHGGDVHIEGVVKGRVITEANSVTTQGPNARVAKHYKPEFKP